MTDMGSQSKDFYAVLGLPRTCSTSEIRSAYRRLAMMWHPDKCSGNTDPEQAKLRFQAIQEAYAVLSDSTKRFLYDAGVYEEDDDDDKDYGMCDFLGEITRMMKEVKEQNDSYEDLKDVFMKMVNPDIPPTCNGQPPPSVFQCNGRPTPPLYQCNDLKQKPREPTSSRASFSKQQQQDNAGLQRRTTTQRCKSKKATSMQRTPIEPSNSSGRRRRRTSDTNSCNIFDDNSGLGLGIDNPGNSHLGLGFGIHFPMSSDLNFKLDSHFLR